MPAANAPDADGGALRSAWYAHAMERLVEVVQQLSLARDLAGVMSIVRRAARELTGADGATFVLRDGQFCHYADEDAIAPLWKGQRFPLDVCVSGWAMRERAAAAIEDIYADPRVPADAYRPTFVRSLAMVPIRTLDPVGAIGNYWAARHAPSADEVRVLQALADTTAVAMENVRVYAELEARVVQRTAALQAILDHVEVGVAFTVDGCVERANPKLGEILGAEPGAELAGQDWRALLRPAEPDANALARLGDAAASAGAQAAELKLMRIDSGAFWARVASRALPAEHGANSTIWVVDDISEAKARERALDELRRSAESSARFKADFLASMSHELRTPMNAIMGFSEVLRDGLAGELTSRQLEYISDIYDSGAHLLALINDVLDLSKIEAGGMQIDDEPAELAPLLSACLSVVREKAIAKRIALREAIADDLGIARVDLRRCRQIVYNLLSNAVKFTPDGGTVLLRATAIDAPQARRAMATCDRLAQPPAVEATRLWLQIDVVDSGIGIADDAMARLFEPFVQIDSSLARQYQGTGLGLTLVRRLCALHGGAVGLRSRAGAGSTFSVWLPLHRVDVQAALDAAGERAARPPVADGRPLALIVDDDPRATGLMRVQLESAGCEAIAADSAEDALERLQRVRPDLIVLDVLLPGIDGWALLATIKADAALASIPVVIVSIIADSGRGMALGAVEALQKPVPASLLRDVLQRLALLDRGPTGPGATVLAVDDDAQALEIVTSMLESNGCIALRAQQGRDALEIARRSRPDLVIVDLLMPGFSGFELIAALRTDPATAEIPVVVLTAMPLDAAERAALQAQACSVVSKSQFNAQRLYAVLRQALAQR